MPSCPEGHESVATDYCDYCGSPMAAEPLATTLQVTECPGCGALMEGRYCEDCGFDSVLGAPEPVAAAPIPPPPAVDSPRPAPDIAPAWVATITADPAHFQRMRAQKGPDMDRVDFPAYYPARRIPLPEGDILIGKRSTSQGVNPEIDLSIAPADIAVSRSHAILRRTEAAMTVTDLGSTNGTCVNDSPTPIPARTAVPLRPGDRIHVGGWTTITLTTEPS
ncbi:FHA domain-containing protein [Nocardia sp. NPDC005978]|uniref:FHA domain-containing protein n=1 Tax=Nocardia sp. NPDC005978 TaxID=3156725 RepID=UPI00339E26E4